MPPDAASSSPHENTGLCARYRPCFVFKGTVPRCTTTFVHHRKSDRCPCVAAASPMTQLRPLHNAMTACRCPKPRTATLSNPIGFPKGFALWPPEAAPRMQLRSGLESAASANPLGKPKDPALWPPGRLFRRSGRRFRREKALGDRRHPSRRAEGRPGTADAKEKGHRVATMPLGCPLVEAMGLEPTTSALRTQRSPS